MNIKTTKLLRSVHDASIVVAGVQPAGQTQQISMMLRAYDAHGIVEGIGRVVMTPAEARVLAERLIREATDAEALNNLPSEVASVIAGPPEEGERSMTCRECGAPCREDDSPGVFTHTTDDGETDYEADADHVAIPERRPS